MEKIMIELRNFSYEELSEKARNEHKDIIVYGAGMIGQIVMPDVLNRFGLVNYLRFYVDADPYKQGRRISVDNADYEIRSPEELRAYCRQKKDSMILITNSHFEPVIRALTGLRNWTVWKPASYRSCRWQRLETRSIRRR